MSLMYPSYLGYGQPRYPPPGARTEYLGDRNTVIYHVIGIVIILLGIIGLFNGSRTQQQAALPGSLFLLLFGGAILAYGFINNIQQTRKRNLRLAGTAPPASGAYAGSLYGNPYPLSNYYL